MQPQLLLQEVNLLPPELQKQVFDFIIFLRKQQQPRLTKRTVGEYRNQIIIHDDFDEPLPEQFWLGES
jgi:hypothetical protein